MKWKTLAHKKNRLEEKIYRLQKAHLLYEDIGDIGIFISEYLQLQKLYKFQNVDKVLQQLKYYKSNIIIAGMETTNSLPTPNQEDISNFFIAIRSGSADQMKEILYKYKGNISNKLESQLRQPPLYFAVIYTDENLGFQMTKALIQAGANPQFKDANQQTIMFYCCRDGKRIMAEYLLTMGSKIDEQDLYGQTPIYYVASENRLNLLDLFSSQMVNHVDKLAKQTPLYYAARKGHLQMCKALIEKGADINHLDSSNKSAIQYAKKSKFQEVVDFLSSETKKMKEINKSNNQSVQQSSQNQTNRKKKKQNASLNMNKNNYKISVYRENGQIHDLTQQEVKQLYKINPDLQTYLTNPDSIPQDLLQSTLQQTWQKAALKILNICSKLKGAFWFLEPVDPVKFGITNYFDIVTKPMDLGTIKKKLNYNMYSNPQQFVEDMRQVFKNCYLYNGQQHQISGCAREVEGTFEESIKSQGLNKFLS